MDEAPSTFLKAVVFALQPDDTLPMRIWLLALFQILAVMHCHSQDAAPGPKGSGEGGLNVAVQDMTPEQLTAKLDGPEVHIYDCNEADLFAEMHVPGARLIVYDAITIDQLPADHNDTLVFYCYSPECPASHTAASTARSLGYEHVYYMLAGIIGWQDAGLRTEP